MSRRELSRGNKGLWQRVEALWRSMLPRQARVTRTSGSTVWVRFIDEGSDAPESQFPSTVTGVPVGTMGWVVTLGGNKGLFVATAVTLPKQEGASAFQTISVSTAGDYPVSNAAVSIPGLIPGAVYKVKVDVSLRVSGGASTSSGPGFVLTSAGTSQFFGAPNITLASSNMLLSCTIAINHTADAEGKITAAPALRWGVGSSTVTWGAVALTIS